MTIAHSVTNFFTKGVSRIKIKLFVLPYLIWLVLFAIIPMIFIIYYSFTNETGGLTFENFSDISNYSKIFLRSILLSSLSTIISLIIGYPTAYAISKSSRKVQKILISALILQMWVSVLLTTYSLMTILESNGILNKTFRFFGINIPPLINSPKAIVIGSVYNSLPFMIFPIYSSISKINKDIIEAANDLGANKFTIFSKILLPISKPGVISGIMMVLSPNISSFLFSKMLGGNQNILIGEVIELKFLGSLYDPWTGSSLALILVLFIFLCNSIISANYNKKNS